MPVRVPPGVGPGRALLRIKSFGSTALQEKIIDDCLDARRNDQIFLRYIFGRFGDSPFERGDLDAGRINRLYNREIVLVSGGLEDAWAMLQINIQVAKHLLAREDLQR